METWQLLVYLWFLPVAVVHATPLLDGTTIQQPIAPTRFGHGAMTLTLQNHGFIEYSTAIAVGNPRQQFQALVDLSVSASFVPSIKCWEEECNIHPLYNASASSTYISDGERVEVLGGMFYTWGNTSIDSFHFGYVEVQNQSFNEADILHPFGFLDESSYDAVLPLARTTVPQNFESNMSVPSVFQNALEQDVLEKNVIAFNLPISKQDVGTVSIGGIEENRARETDDVAHLPIMDGISLPAGEPSELIHGGWYVEAVSLRLETVPGPVYFNLSGYITMFETSMPFTTLPKSFFDQMIEITGAEQGFVFHHLPCERTQNLPDLVISLRGRHGKVHDFVMHDSEYATSEIDLHIEPDGYCTLAVVQERTPEPDTPDFIRLGTWFWRKYYTVFDADEMEISLYPRKEAE